MRGTPYSHSIIMFTSFMNPVVRYRIEVFVLTTLCNKSRGSTCRHARSHAVNNYRRALRSEGAEDVGLALGSFVDAVVHHLQELVLASFLGSKVTIAYLLGEDALV